MCLLCGSKEKRIHFLFNFECACWNATDAAFDSTQDQAARENIKAAHHNSDKEWMDTCYLVSGEILKSCLVIILQKSQRD